jgi:hypothetical protein
MDNKLGETNLVEGFCCERYECKEVRGHTPHGLLLVFAEMVYLGHQMTIGKVTDSMLHRQGGEGNTFGHDHRWRELWASQSVQ